MWVSMCMVVCVCIVCGMVFCVCGLWRMYVKCVCDAVYVNICVYVCVVCVCCVWCGVVWYMLLSVVWCHVVCSFVWGMEHMYVYVCVCVCVHSVFLSVCM